MQVFEPVAPEELVRSQDTVCVLGDEIFVGKFPSQGLVYRNFNGISQEIQVGSGNPGS